MLWFGQSSCSDLDLNNAELLGSNIIYNTTVRNIGNMHKIQESRAWAPISGRQIAEEQAISVRKTYGDGAHKIYGAKIDMTNFGHAS